jgi:hypothetical protein
MLRKTLPCGDLRLTDWARGQVRMSFSLSVVGVVAASRPVEFFEHGTRELFCLGVSGASVALQEADGTLRVGGRGACAYGGCARCCA